MHRPDSRPEPGYPQQVSGQVRVRQAGRDCGGAPEGRPGQVEQGDVAVEGVGVEMRMSDDLLDLYLLLVGIRTFFIVVT